MTALIEPDLVQDPVCGHLLHPADAAQTYVYHEQPLHFDSNECFQKFLLDPEAFREGISSRSS